MTTTNTATDHDACYREMTEAELRRIYWGAWTATDRGAAYSAKKELIRRGLSVQNMGWPSMDLSTWVSY